MTWFKKKLISVALVGSLVFSLAGTSVFAMSSEVPELNTILSSIQDELVDSEPTTVSNAKSAVNTYVTNTSNNPASIVTIVNKINAVAGSAIVTKDEILDLFGFISTVYFDGISGSLTSDQEDLLDVLDQNSVQDGVGSWKEEIARFFNLVNDELVDNAGSLVLNVATANSQTALIDGSLSSINELLDNSNNLIIQILRYYNINQADIKAVLTDLNTGTSGAFYSGIQTVLVGYVRTKGVLSNETTNAAHSKSYTFKILNHAIPNIGLFTWVSDSNVTISDNGSGTITVSNKNQNSSSTPIIKLRVNVTGNPLNGQDVFISDSNQILLGVAPATPTPTPSTNSGGSVATPTPTPAPISFTEESKVEAAKEIEKVIVAIPTPIPGQDNQTISKNATKAIQDVIEKQSHVNISDSVIVTGDKAKVELDTSQLTDLFKSVKDNAAKLNDKLAAIDPNAEKAKVTVTLDMGTQSSNNTEVPITVDLIDKAKQSGIDSMAFQVNNISLSVDVDQIKGSTTLNINKQPVKTATDATQLKVASDVYNFEFTDADNQNITFTKPVVLKLPITDVSDIDTDLLTLAKIINGKLEYYGGKYNVSGKYFEAERKSFSTYVIVENKVDFNDTASVLAWAGKDIGITAAKGIIQGRGQGVFAPNDKVTRAEFATMIVKTFHLEDSAAVSPFSDVQADDWFVSSVAAASKAGLINGRTASTFEPNATISRAEMAAISARALKVVKGYKNTSDNTEALAKFNDASSINASLTEGVALASSQGIIIGNENNFNPNGLSTRAEAAVVISRLLNK